MEIVIWQDIAHVQTVVHLEPANQAVQSISFNVKTVVQGFVVIVQMAKVELSSGLFVVRHVVLTARKRLEKQMVNYFGG